MISSSIVLGVGVVPRRKSNQISHKKLFQLFAAFILCVFVCVLCVSVVCLELFIIFHVFFFGLHLIICVSCARFSSALLHT